jgi:hypothetical protein
MGLWLFYHILWQRKRPNIDRGGRMRSGPNSVLCTTYSVLLCVLEQPRVGNSNTGPLSAGPNWEQFVQLD